jgi:broad specificity phosphatase PhoE
LDITPQYTKALREKSWGEHEGMSFDEICKTGLKYESFEQWIEDLRGESIAEFKKRVFDFFDYIYTLEYKHILIVTHSGVIKTFISNIENISLKKAFSTQVPYGFAKTYDIIIK